MWKYLVQNEGVIVYSCTVILELVDVQVYRDCILMSMLLRLHFFIAAQMAQSCPVNAIQMGQATWAICAALKKYNLNLYSLKPLQCLTQLFLFLCTGKGAVYSFDPVGSYERETYRAGGSAGAILQPLLDNQVYVYSLKYYLNLTKIVEQCWILFLEVLEVNLFAFAYRLFYEDFSPIYF